MAWTAPRSWSDGEIVQGSFGQQNWHDDLLESYVAKMQAAGDIAYGTGANALARLVKGNAYDQLEVSSGGGAYDWRTPPDPWRVEVAVAGGGSGNTNWNTPTSDASAAWYGWLQSTGAQNALVDFPLFLAAGTWACRLVHTKDADAGIYSVRLDDVEQGTVDGYAAIRTRDQVSDVTGIVVSTPGIKTFRLKMATKNGSSSSYYGRVQRVVWFRTA